MEKQQVEDRLLEFFTDKMVTGDAPEIEDVRRFKGHFVTRDNGIVIDCADGSQICLTIQIRI